MASSIFAIVDANSVSGAQILLSLALIIASYVSYQIFFHPLRNYPGPLLAKITSGYGAFYVWRRCLHLRTIPLHRQYGPVVRIAPNRLAFSSATAIQDIYNNPRATKGQAYDQIRHSGRGTTNMFNTRDKELHRVKRRVIGPVIGEASMCVFEPDMISHINSFLRVLLRSTRNGGGEEAVVNMTPRCEQLGVDIIGQLAFGYQLNTLRDPTHRAVVEGIKARSGRSSLYFSWSVLRFLEGVFNLVEGDGPIREFHNSLQMMIMSRMALPKDARHDFYFLASGDGAGEEGLISKELWAEAIFFIAAGGSTVATAMSGVFFYLSRNADAYQRATSEVRAAFASGNNIVQGPQLNSCKYLRAVIEETMRMSPSTLGHAWREQDPASVAAGESFIVDGHVVPPGTQVAISNFAINHDEAYFSEPYRFAPERWLTAEAGSTADGTSQKNPPTALRRAFAPFSIGDRGCAGKPMAWLEMRLAVAKTLWYFDFERAPGPVGDLGGGQKGTADYGRGRADEFQLYDSIVVGHDGPNLVFTPRGDTWRDLE